MADSQFYTLEAATKLASVVKTSLAVGKLLLGNNSFVPTASATKAQLNANELVADGYTAGGYAVAAFTGPLNDPGGGAVITSPLVNVAYGPASDPPVTGSVGFWWYEDTDGDVRLTGIFNPPRPLAQLGDGWPQILQNVCGRNPVPVG